MKARYLTKLKRLGQLSFEDRLKALFDEGSLALLNAPNWDEAWKQAVVTAEGTVEGRPALAYASNYLVEEGTLGIAETRSIITLLERASRKRLPVVALLQSNGARVSEGYGSLGGNAELFLSLTRHSGVAPQLTACMGLCSGVPAYIAALADLVWMIPGESYTFTTSPSVIRVATGQRVNLNELGGASMHAAKSGVAHFLADDDASCIAELRSMLGYLSRDRREPVPPSGAEIEAVVPKSPFVPYDVRGLIEAIFDGGSFMEVHRSWGEPIVVGVARLDGHPVGLVANQSKVRGGALDVEAIRKASRFVRLCDAHGLPLFYLVDVPGIMVSVEQEQAAILSAGGVLFHAVDTDVPRIALIVRKCFGGAFVMLQAKQAGGDRVLAYPTAQIGIAGAEASFAILHGKEFLTHEAPDAFRKEALEGLRRVPSDAYAAQRAGIVDAVIDPRHTRRELITSLEALQAAPARIRPPRRSPLWSF